MENSLPATPQSNSSTTPVPPVAPVPPSPMSPASTPQIAPNKKWTTFIGSLLVLGFLIGGLAFASKYFQKPATAPEVVVSPSPLEAPITNSIEGWRTIIRDDWKVQVPAAWNYLACVGIETALYIGSMHTSDTTMECNFEPTGTVWVNTELANYEIPVDKTDPQTGQPILKIAEKKSITVANQPAVWQKEEVSRVGEVWVQSIKVYIQQNNKTYIITLADLSQENTFNQILSTFEFLEPQASTSEIKTVECVNGTYKDDSVGFSIECPSNVKAYVYKDELSFDKIHQEKIIYFCESPINLGSGQTYQVRCSGGVMVWANGDGWGGGCDPENHSTVLINGQEKGYCLYDEGFGQLYSGDPEYKDKKDRFLLGGIFSKTFTKETALKMLNSFKTN